MSTAPRPRRHKSTILNQGGPGSPARRKRTRLAALAGVLGVVTALSVSPASAHNPGPEPKPADGRSAPSGTTPDSGLDHDHPTPTTMLAEAKKLGVADLIVGSGDCGGLLQTPDGHCTHGPDPFPPGVTPGARTAPAPSATSRASVVCDGDGVSGYRVQVLYVHTAGTADRFAAYSSSFQTWVGRIDQYVKDSAAETGGARRVRWVQNADCSVPVLDLTLSAASYGDYTQTWSELRTLGYNRTDRKYLIYADWDADYCGIGELFDDLTSASANINNDGNTMALVTQSCWDETVSATGTHELFHNMGAVQNGSPYSTGNGHCWDGELGGADIMCYSENGHTAFDRCGTAPPRLDCGHDDYFHTNPTGSNFLAGNWNTADNRFLIGSNDDFEQAYPLGGGSCAPVIAGGTTVGATLQGEPSLLASSSNSVWYSWVAPGAGPVTVDLGGSSFDTVLGVYTGSTRTSLTQVAADNDSGAGTTSLVQFVATRGTTYWIAVDGVGSATGDIALRLTGSGPVAGDCFASPLTRNGAGVVTFDSSNATGETGEPNSTSNRSVWVSFTPTSTGQWLVDTSGTGFDSLLGVYQGTVLGSLTTLASDDDAGAGLASSAVVSVVAGQTYRVAVGGFSDTESGAGRVSFQPLGYYVPMTPQRLLDTRTGVGGSAVPWGPNETRAVTITGTAGVPADARSVVLSVSTVNPTADGFARVWPTGSTEPSATILNFSAGESGTNVIVASPGTGSKANLKVYGSGTSHVVVDVLGYFAATGSEFRGLTPARILDSRTGLGTTAAPFAANSVRTAAVRGVGGVPSTATGSSAAVLAVSVVNPEANGFLRVYPSGGAQPPGTVLNWSKGRSRTGFVISALGSDGRVAIFNGSGGSTHVVVEVVGYFVPSGSGDGAAYVPVTPHRLVDSRSGTGTSAVAWGNGEHRTVGVTGVGMVPDLSVGTLGTLSAVTPNANGWGRLTPSGTSPTSTVINFVAGRSLTTSVVAVPQGGMSDLWNYNASQVHYTLDAHGLFVDDIG